MIYKFTKNNHVCFQENYSFLIFSCSYTIGKQKNGDSINVEVGHLALMFPLQNHINVNIQIPHMVSAKLPSMVFLM